MLLVDLLVACASCQDLPPAVVLEEAYVSALARVQAVAPEEAFALVAATWHLVLLVAACVCLAVKVDLAVVVT